MPGLWLRGDRFDRGLYFVEAMGKQMSPCNGAKLVEHGSCLCTGSKKIFPGNLLRQRSSRRKKAEEIRILSDGLGKLVGSRQLHFVSEFLCNRRDLAPKARASQVKLRFFADPLPGPFCFRDGD